MNENGIFRPTTAFDEGNKMLAKKHSHQQDLHATGRMEEKT